MDVFGSALLDEFNNDAVDILWLNNNYGEPEEMPVEVFFRDEAEMPVMEQHAIKLCKGKILDVGAGAGSHSLLLQQYGFDITSIDISAIACSIMRQRGIKQVIHNNFFSYQDGRYDTLLMLMNGIGIAGNLNKLSDLLTYCKLLLKDGGQIVFDSSDISYLYEDIPLPRDKYFGEICYQYEYKTLKSNWFDWLYVDKHTLTSVAEKLQLKSEIIMEDENDQYLARLTMK